MLFASTNTRREYDLELIWAHMIIKLTFVHCLSDWLTVNIAVPCAVICVWCQTQRVSMRYTLRSCKFVNKWIHMLLFPSMYLLAYVLLVFFHIACEKKEIKLNNVLLLIVFFSQPSLIQWLLRICFIRPPSRANA